MLERGTVVCLTDLRSQPELNGAHGCVLQWDADRERYGVSIAANGVTKSLALRSSNLCVVEKEEACSIERIQTDAIVAHQMKAHELAFAIIKLLERFGRKREAYDTLLRFGGSDRSLVQMRERLAAEGQRDGWLQFSQASVTESAFRTSNPHCAVCLRPTPSGRPAEDCCCGRCGMVQYCSAKHKDVDSTRHRAQCDTLRQIAWRRLWEHTAGTIELDVAPAACDASRGFELRHVSGSAMPSPRRRQVTTLLRECSFPVLSRDEVVRMRTWSDFFSANDVQRRWLCDLPPIPDRLSSGGSFGHLLGPPSQPLPSPSGATGAPKAPAPAADARALAAYIGHASRLLLGDLLTDALTAVHALREAHLLLPAENKSPSGERLSSHLLPAESKAHQCPADGRRIPGVPWRLHVVGAESAVEGRRAHVFHRAVNAAVNALLHPLPSGSAGADADEHPQTHANERANSRAARSPPLGLVEATEAMGVVDVSDEPTRTAGKVRDTMAAGGDTKVADSSCSSDRNESSQTAVRTVHIGPHMSRSEVSHETDGATAASSSFRGTYVEYTRSSAYERPDALVAFHPGVYVNHHGYSWLETLEIAISLGIPVVLTSMLTEDARCTREFLRAIDANVLIDAPNAFASPRAEQAYFCENLLSVRNCHLFVFHGVNDRSRLNAEERRRRVAVAGDTMMERLRQNPLDH